MFSLMRTIRPTGVKDRSLGTSLGQMIAKLGMVVGSGGGNVLDSDVSDVIIHVAGVTKRLGFCATTPRKDPHAMTFPLIHSISNARVDGTAIVLFPSFKGPRFRVDVVLGGKGIGDFGRALGKPLRTGSGLALALALKSVFSRRSSKRFALSG